jgi:hypothetical protein
MTQTEKTQIPSAGQIAEVKTQTASTNSAVIKAKIEAGTVKIEGKKAVVKKEAPVAATTPAAVAAPVAPVSELTFDVSINAWGDMMVGSKARKALAAAGLSSEHGKDYIPFLFTVGADGKVSFVKTTAETKAGDGQYIAMLVSRNGSFYHKKAARAVLESNAKIVIGTLLKITYQKESKGFFVKA